MQAKVKLVRKRRRHSEEFRAQVVAACWEPGVSVAAVALANGLNANLLRRWIKESAERVPVAVPRVISPAPQPMTVVPVAIECGEGGDDIRIDLRRSGITVQLAWPATRMTELSGLLKDLLK
jgi:transposase